MRHKEYSMIKRKANANLFDTQKGRYKGGMECATMNPNVNFHPSMTSAPLNKPPRFPPDL